MSHPWASATGVRGPWTGRKNGPGKEAKNSRGAAAPSLPAPMGC